MALTVDLVPRFNARNGHHRAGELQVWVRRLAQLLRLAHLRTRKTRTLEVDDPVVWPRRWRPRLEERSQDEVRRRQLEQRRDAQRALAGAGHRHRSPTLPGAKNRALISVDAYERGVFRISGYKT